MKPYQIPEKVSQQLQALREQPGVYLFKDRSEAVIYVGKAVNLRSRVRSYFNTSQWAERPKLAFLVPKIESMDTIVTNSEKEALLLEATMVRQHLPRYNVALKDDKRYPWLCITYRESFPRLIMIRDPQKHRAKYPGDRVFGPYVQTGLMWETVKALRKVFPMRQREKPLFKDRPCMNYHIGLCLAPCVKLVEEESYDKMVRQVELFLSGQQSRVVDELKSEMERLAEALEFEKAARLRDRLLALNSVLERQQVLFKDEKICVDAFAEAHTEKTIVICLLRVRQGKLVGQESFDLALVDKTGFDEAFQSFIDQYYSALEGASIPGEVVLQHGIDDWKVLQEILSQRRDRSVKVGVPSRGDKLKLLDLARKNASQALEQLLQEEEGANAQAVALLSRVQEDLALSKLPRRIECFDISNIQGSDNVASMVAFENGRARKGDYRTFKIRTVEGTPDDFASMKEVVGRRMKRLQAEAKPLPDLIIIDGGKGQLSAAIEALFELGISGQDIIGLAKRREEVFKPGEQAPILLSRRSEALYLLQRVRDEAHRFAVTFHRKLRARRALSSGFDSLPGVGPARRKQLILKFGTVDNLRQAALDEIKSVPGLSDKAALAIFDHLHPQAFQSGQIKAES